MSRRSTYQAGATRPQSDMGVYGIGGDDEGLDVSAQDDITDTQNRLRQIEKRLNAKGVCSAESNAIRARSILLAGGSQRKQPTTRLMTGCNSSDRRGSTHHHSSTPGVGSKSQFLDKLDEAFGVLDSGGVVEVDSSLDVQGLQGYFPSTAQHSHSAYMGRLNATNNMNVNDQPRGGGGGNPHRRSATSLSSSQHNPHYHNTSAVAPTSIMNTAKTSSSPPPLHPKGQSHLHHNQQRGGELGDVLEQRRRHGKSTSSVNHRSDGDGDLLAAPSVLSVGDVFQQAKQSAVYPHAEAQLRAHMKKRTDSKKHYPSNDHDVNNTPAGPVARYLRSRGQLGQDKEVPFARLGEGIPVSLQLTAHEVHGGDPAVKKEADRIRLKAEESVKKNAIIEKNTAAKKNGAGSSGGGAVRTMLPDDGASPDSINALREEADAIARGDVRRLCEQPAEGDLLFSKMDPSSLVYHAETTLGRREKHHAESVARTTHAARSVLAPKTASLVSGLLIPDGKQSSMSHQHSASSSNNNNNAELREALQRSSALQAVFLAESDSDDDEMDDEKERNVEELIETGDARRKRRRDIRAAVLLGMLAATQHHGGGTHSLHSISSAPPIVTETDMLRASDVIGRAAAGAGIPTPLDAIHNTTTASTSKPSPYEIEVTPEEALEDVCDLLECCVVAFCQYLHRNTFLVGQSEGGPNNRTGGGGGLYSPSYTGPPRDIGVLRGILVQALSSSLPELKIALEYGTRDGSGEHNVLQPPTSSSSKTPESPMQAQKVFSPNAPTNLSVTAMLFSGATGGGGSSAMTPAMKALLDGRVSELRFRFLRSWTKAAETLLSLDLKHHRSTVLLQPRSNNHNTPSPGSISNRQKKHWDADNDGDDHSDQIFKFSVSHPAATAHERHHRQTRVPPSFFMVHFDEHLQHAASYYCSLHRRRIARSQELMQRWRANRESRETKLLHGAAVNPFHAELDPRYLEDLQIERARNLAGRTASDGSDTVHTDTIDDPINESRSHTRSRINGMIDFFTSAKEQLSAEDLSALDFNSANVIHKQRTLVSAFLEKLIPKLKQGDDFKYTGTVEGKLLSRITEQQQDASTRMAASALPSNPYDLSAEELITVREGDTANKEAMSVLQRVLLKVNGSKAARTAELYGGVSRNEASKQQQGGCSLAGVPREGRQVSRFREVVMRYANLDHEDFDNEEFGINPSVEEEEDDMDMDRTHTTASSTATTSGPILSSRADGGVRHSSPSSSTKGAGASRHIAQAKFMSLFRSSWGRSPLDRNVPSDEAGIRSQVLEDALLVRVLDAYFYLLSHPLQSKIRQFVQQAKRQAREAEAAEQRDQALTTGGGAFTKIKLEEESAGLRALKETLGAQMRDKYSNNDIAIERRFHNVKARRAELAERLRSGDTSVISELVLGNKPKTPLDPSGVDPDGGLNTNAADRALAEKAKKLHKLLNSTDSWFVYEQNKRHAFDELSKHDLFSKGGGESQGGPPVSEGDPLPLTLGLLSSNLRRPTQGPQGGSEEGGKVGSTGGGRPKNEVTRLKRLHELEASWSLLQISHSQRINLNDKWATMRVEGRLLDRATALYREAATRVVKREGILEDIVANEKRLLKLVPGGNSLLGAMSMLHSGSAQRSTSSSSSFHNQRPDTTTYVPTTKKECELLRHKLLADLTKASQECDVISHRLHQEVGDDLFFRDIAYLAKMRGDAVGLKDLIKRTGVAM